MTKTEQMRRVIFGIRIAIATVVLLFIIVSIARCGDGSQSGNGYTPSLIDGLFSLVVVLLSLYLNSLRSRIAKLEGSPVVTLEVCKLKREKDEQVVLGLVESTHKMEVHIEEIFKTCNSIKILLASNGKKNGE